MGARHRFSSCSCATDWSIPTGRHGQASTTSGCAPTGARIWYSAPRLMPPMKPWCKPLARRDRLDQAIENMAAGSEFTPVVNRLCCLRGVSTLTGFALAVEITDWHRFTGNTIGSFLVWFPRSTPPGSHGARFDHQDRELSCPPSVGRGRLASPPRLQPKQAISAACPLGESTRRSPAARTSGQPTTAPAMAEVHRPQEASGHRQRRHRPRALRLVLVTGRDGRLTRKDR